VSAAEDELVRMLAKIGRRAALGGPVKRKHRPRVRKADPPATAFACGCDVCKTRAQRLADETAPAIRQGELSVDSPANSPELPRQRTAVEAWLDRPSRSAKPLSGREWVSQRSRSRWSATRGLKDMEF
jgi:hypothetical protein